VATVGEIVLFRLGASTQRPLLVVSADGHVVSGDVFVDWDLDRTEEWFSKGFATPPHPEKRQIEVRGVQMGPGIGQWEHLGTVAWPEDSAAIAAAAEAKREGLMPAPEATPPAQQGPSALSPSLRPPLQKISVGRGPRR
jgi:hypothetical protein